MGGDAAGVSDYDKRLQNFPKVFLVDDFLIGYTTSFRMGQILQYHLRPPEHETVDMPYMVTKFVPEVRKLLIDHGFATKENNYETGGCFMVGCQGQLFTIERSFQVLQSVDRYEAIGCGAPYALGALRSMFPKGIRDPGISLEDSITSALQTAAYFSAGVSEPFSILSLPSKL
jgi:hypothetical protein